MRFKAIILQRLLRIDELRHAHATTSSGKALQPENAYRLPRQVKHMVWPPRDGVPSGPPEPVRRPAALPRVPAVHHHDVTRGDRKDGRGPWSVGAPLRESLHVPVVPQRADDCGRRNAHGQSTPAECAGICQVMR
jgi:hypothetical protein